MKRNIATASVKDDKHVLSPQEAGRLAELEPIIAKGMGTFVEVGTALLEISDRRLYRQTHSTFKDYVQDKWKISVRQAYRLCESVEVIKSLPAGCDQLVATESQARELVKVPVTERAEVLAAVAVAGNGAITAKCIKLEVMNRTRAIKPHKLDIDPPRCTKRPRLNCAARLFSGHSQIRQPPNFRPRRTYIARRWLNGFCYKGGGPQRESA